MYVKLLVIKNMQIQQHSGYAVAGNLLNDSKLNSKVTINLDCADISTDYTKIVHKTLASSTTKYLRKMSEIEDISYPRFNKDLEKTFTENLENILWRKFDYNNIEKCQSIFPYLERFLHNLTSNGKNVKVFVPEDLFGYFRFIAEKKGCEVELIKTSKDYKIDIESFNNISTKDDDQTRVLLWLNPINPTQSVYTKEEITTLKDKINQNFDIILEDLTFAELYNGRYPDGVLNGYRTSFECEDIDKIRNIQKPYFLCQTHALKDKTMILYSIAKSLYAKDRISMVYTPENLKQYIIDDKSPNEKFDGYPIVEQLVEDLLKNKVPIINAHTEFYKETHQHIVNECNIFNMKLQHLFGKNIDFIKPIPKEWKSANTLIINVKNLYNSLKENHLINEKHVENYADMYEFFITNTKTKMIPGSLNNMTDENLYFRLPLGGLKVKENITQFFKNLYSFIVQNKENIYFATQYGPPSTFGSMDFLLTQQKPLSIFERDWYSKDDTDKPKHAPQTLKTKQSYEGTFLSK
jgi:aspartate/methionine/tyrosine aminotransferase